MKKLLLVCSLILLTTQCYLHASLLQNDGPFKITSLRTEALGGAFVDDQDRAFDPIELHYVEGFRLFTNLGNNDGGDDQLLSGEGSSSYLIGFAVKNPFVEKLSNSILFKYQNSDRSNNVSIDHDFDGAADLFGKGELTSEYSSFNDVDSDGIYDLKQSTSYRKSDFSFFDSHSFISNNSYDFTDYILGLKFGYNSSTGEYTSASDKPFDSQVMINTGTLGGVISGGDSEFDYSYKNYLIGDGYSDFSRSEEGDFSTEYCSSNMLLDVSASMLDFRGYEVRADLAYLGGKNSDITEDRYAGGKETFTPEMENFIEKYQENGSFDQTEEEDGGLVRLGASIYKTLKKGDSRAKNDFWEAGVNFGIGSYDYTNSWQRSLSFTETESYLDTDSLAVGVQWVDRWNVNKTSKNEVMSDEGTNDVYSMAIGGRFAQNLNSLVRFAAASSIRFNGSSRETDWSSSYGEEISDITGEYFVDAAADYFDAAEDSKVFTRESQKAKRTYESAQTLFTASSGIEFKIAEDSNWVMRIGSVYTVDKTVVDDKKQIKEAKARVREVHLGDGNYQVSTDDNSYWSESSHKVTTNSQTVFTYGIGYQPNDNLCVDFLTVFDGSDSADDAGENEDVFDLKFIKSIKLGLSLKF